jgi:hypothetical protein
VLGVFLFAWVVFPLAMIVLCLGAGLALRRVSGASALPLVLVLPAGLAVLVVLCGLLCYFKGTAQLAGPACAVVGVGGLLVGRAALGEIRARGLGGVDRWALVAGLGAWAVFAAPIVLSGKPGFTGYAHIVDISYELDLSAHFAHAGRATDPTVASSAYQTVLNKYLASGYPGGGPWTLGALSNLTPIDLSWLYQPFLAFVAAMSSLSMYRLLAGVVPSRGVRALGAFIASQANVLAAYGMTGGIKELCTSSFLLLSAALFAEAFPRMRPGRGVVAIPVALAATLASLSLTTLPWLGVLAVGVALTAIAFGRARLAAFVAGLQMAASFVVLSLPTLAAGLKLLPVVSGSGPVDLGNLSQAMPAIASAGVWISGDYRFPQYAHRGLSEAIAVLVLVLAAIGLVHAIRRRAWSVAWLGAAGAIALYYVAHRYGPWIQFKADCISSPIALLLAFAGVGQLMRVGRRLRSARPRLGRVSLVALPALPAAVVVFGVLAGSALLYHNTTLAPYERLHNLEAIGGRFAGQGPTLTPDFEEYAEYYLRDDDQTSMVNGPTLGVRVGVNREAEPGGIFEYDLDEFSLSWLEGFHTIVMRRDPLSSRPPSNYRLVYLSRWYEVWQRSSPASGVRVHLVAPSGTHRAAFCAGVRTAARGAGAAAQIAYTTPPSGYRQLDSSDMKLTRSFLPEGGPIHAVGRGRATGEAVITRAGAYELFLGGSIGRPVDVRIDGRRVGGVAYQISYPDQWVLIGLQRLTAGRHRVELTRGGFSFHAGNGNGEDGLNRTIGPLDIVPAGGDIATVHYASSNAFQQVCRSSQPLRWVEVVRAS